jgi:hypothetical protein
MRGLTGLTVVAASGILFGASSASAEDKYEAMGKCYQAYGQIETVMQDGKKITTYKDQAQVAAECNARVVEKAKAETKVDDILGWAKVIGVNSNWQSAMPVFTLAARADASKATCTAKDPLYSLELALSAPSDNPWAVNAFAFLNACWPKNRDTLVDFLTKDGYVKDNACKFLGDKNALPDGKKWLCSTK